ncbi:AAA family ATPase [Leptolyngbya sp. FACHB-541]|uniref:ATP-dependent nuclease n=1 Tax=Leptolyngbya sp. FACHB-541 TaxID=2692810 RepID=UPI00168596A5|nr:AAA family ATPase [Leptolyngbya sp. FACHB-541]MBD1997828.1 AAA family ATPase [Leptolyngbya sp. FACHB-541]
MSRRKPVDDLQTSVRALKQKTPYICSLRFPNYRNLRFDSELSFDFPITVLLGRNGTNKSSVLHALYGSPLGQTIADFWFETELDAIPSERNGRKQSVVHRYRKNNGDIVECIKARAPRGSKDPDYWEAVKHSKVYNLPVSGTRVRPIELKVTHLDFRGELPAFDKYFYFPDPKHLAERVRSAKVRGKLRRDYRKQDYLRQRSKPLRKAIEEDGLALTTEELEVLKYVLERDYVSGKVLKHSLFHGHEGWTILFKTNQFNGYSDAFAGSGESAAALLVHNILQTPEKSLVLLDEPETSLHPRAQQRMLEFIAHQAVRKSLQVVMATHSIYLAQDLPQEAIRVLVREEDGSVTVRSDFPADEALHEIGTLPPGKTILVEDERAKHIVVSALKLVSSHALRHFEIRVRKGGTSQIYLDIQAYANSERKDVFVIFDGDHKPKDQIPENGALPQGENDLNKLIQKITSGNNRNGPKLNFADVDERTRYIRFFRRFVHFLPGLTPENLVWDEGAAKELLGKKLPDEISQEPNFKQRLHLLAEEIPGFDADTVFKNLLAKLLSSESQRKKDLIEVIEIIRGIQFAV